MVNSVVITGASGLLGREVMKKFSEEGWLTHGLANTRAKHPLIQLDLRNSDKIEEMINNFKPDIIVHCAAERRPDFVENNFENSWQLNVEATETLTKCAKSIGSTLIFISTDYVFDGKNAPYNENDTVNPLNKYGMMKVEGEKIVQKIDQGSIVLRIPLLYGDVEYLEESGVMLILKELLNPDKTKVCSNYELRHPMHTKDIATAIHLLASLKLEEADNICGIYQWCGQQSLTRYQMTEIISKTFNLNMNHITPNPGPVAGAQRPYNVKLDTTRLQKLGAKQLISFSEGIKEAMKKHIL